MRAVVALVLTTLLPLADAVAGPCASGEATSLALTPPNTELPADGGVIVASSTIGLAGEGGAPDAMNPSWRFRSTADDEYKPTMLRLAPGLVSYRPPADAVGELTLASGNLALRTVKRATTEEPVLAAPVVARVRAKTTRATPVQGALVTSVTVALKAKAPKDTFALVLVHVAKDGAQSPTAWSAASAGDKSVIVYELPQRCEPRIPGMFGVKPGEKVALMWVDIKGRLSKPSKTFTVGR